MVEWLKQLALCADLAVEISRQAGSRESGAPSATQRPHPQAAEAIGADEFGPPAVGLAVPTLSFHPERDPDCQARDRDPPAPSRLPSLLALDISPGVGRPPIDGEIRDLIREMSMANPLWGAPRVHGELLMLGFQLRAAEAPGRKDDKKRVAQTRL